VPLDEITERLTLAVINEALHCLQDGIIDQPRTGDIGAILGMGFPAFRGGPFRWVDATGAKEVWDRMQRRQNQHGVRFKPAAILGDHVKSRKPFYTK
jgi:3-hydroxyacyl-CoA dehydrogenase / enoyl-CoA hydratase / 3-hydroxybutyryl-CoA epimerase